jgi:HAD superfamily hydrolase (TIGR01509 family)
MEELVLTLKESGYRIYLLSNASVSQHVYWPKFPISGLFDGKLVSCDYGIVKPNPEIYRLFNRQFGLVPSECLFIDDLPANVAAAVQCGWTGIVFHGDAEELKKKLTKKGIRLNR